jgi:hypothetical protein
MRQRPRKGWADKMCLDHYRRAAQLGCNVLRITMPADAYEDAFAISAFESAVRDLGLPTRLMAYGTGATGKLSRCLNKSMTSVRPSDSSQNDSDYSTARELTEARFLVSIFEPLQFFVYGADVSYSVTPAMHNAAYNVCGAPYTCEARSSNDLDGFKANFYRHDFGGSALAQPYKTKILPLLDGLSPHAKVIGAINSLIPVRDLSVDGSLPNDAELTARSPRRGEVRALYGFNTGKSNLQFQVNRITDNDRLDRYPLMH